MFKYFQYVSGSKTHWSNRFTDPKWHTSCQIQTSSKPGWMQPKDTRAQKTTLSDVQNLSALSKKRWSVIWRRKEKFQGKEEMDEHLEGLDLPSDRQVLEYDPRIHDAPSWRDGLRRQYRCLDLGFTIRTVRLRRISKGDDDEEKQEEETNLLACDWAEAQNTFEEAPCEELTILLGLRKLDEDEELWESPQISTAIREIVPAIAEPDNSPDTNQQAATNSTVTPNRAGNNADDFLEGAQRSDGVIKSLSPNNYFANSSAECAEFFGGIDLVQNPDLIVPYQRKILQLIAGMSPPARKPLRSKAIGGKKLSSEEMAALALAQEKGEAAAVAKEVRISYQRLEKYFSADLEIRRTNMRLPPTRNTTIKCRAHSKVRKLKPALL